MIKVDFFLSNDKLNSIDFSHPEKGNPGVGATQYLFVALSYYLSRHYSDKLQVGLYASYVDFLPRTSNLRIQQAGNVVDAARKAKKSGSEFLVFRPDDSLDYVQLANIDFPCIAWVHNDLTQTELQKLLNCPAIKRFVFVGYEQLHRVRDHRIFAKSTCILNPIDSSIYPDTHKELKEPIVTYMGSLVPSKGFHALARVWPNVLQKVPNAKLWVVGSGQVYDENAVLGKWSIAEESYEAQFRPYLSTPEGTIHPSVYFLGKMGTEKVEVLRQTRVGVVNPTGMTECCPVSALEFQACGVPVVSAARFGILDTVISEKTGLLGETDKELVSNIVRLLKDEEAVRQFGKNARQFIGHTFNWQIISAEWYQLFLDIRADKPVKFIPVERYWFHNYKWLREANRVFKTVTGWDKFPSLVEMKAFFIQLIRKS